MNNTNKFSSTCLYLYGSFCNCENVDRNTFFNYCVDSRLNKLISDNSNQLDYVLDSVEKFIDSIITDKPLYERCSNYKEKNKNIVKYNISWIGKLIKKYNKSCISSSKLLHKLMMDLRGGEGVA
jgi:hypothetical protein